MYLMRSLNEISADKLVEYNACVGQFRYKVSSKNVRDLTLGMPD